MALEPVGGGAARKSTWKFALFGNRTVKSWSSAERPIVVTVFGDQKLDLRGFGPGRIEIVSVGLFGDLELEVDRTTRVRLGGFSIFGDVEEPADPGIHDGQLEVAVTRYGFFGDLEVDIDDDDDDDDDD